ncbi:MAG TPA: ACP S-malonyltransferase [Clostridiaceae bacterium]|nr:ACP S-malonyltransferase [Clostridiaceae bacterium]
MKIGILFSGQGAQYPGMMKDLYDAEPAAKELFDKADVTLGRKISKVCFEGTEEDLNLTHNTQPCMLAGDLAAAQVLKSHGINATAVAGFSLGEYAALAYAGAVSMDAVFPLVQIRADVMQEAVAPGDGAMAAFVGATAEQVEEICSKVTMGYVVAANYNSPVQTVVSGSAVGVDEACELAEAAGLRCIKLAVSAPFHCALMEPAAKRLEEEFKKISFQNPSIPVYMNVDGKPVMDSVIVPELLIKQVMSPVCWVQTLENMQADGIDTFIECGAGKTLSGLVKKTLKGVKVLRVENMKTLQNTLEELQF